MLEANLFDNIEERRLLRKTLVFYIAVGSTCKAEEVSLHFDSFKQIENLTFSQVRAQLIPVLRKSENFDFGRAKEIVIKFLHDFLVFSKEEQMFIRCFNRREYRPEILFPEREISDAIKAHPMALWKCRPKE